MPNGCTRKDDARAESLEVQLTRGPGSKIYPRFSPDGSQVAYSTGPEGKPVVYVVAAAGGDPRRITPEGEYEYVIDWTHDGQGLYTHIYGSTAIHRVALDGTLQDSIPAPNVRYLEDALDDGSAFLAFAPREENYDVGILHADGSLDFLGETSEWELYGTFGPKPGEVTFVRYATYGSPASDLCVWSPATRTAIPLPLPRGKQATPTWSPDGTTLVYCSDVSGNMDLWAYDAAQGRAMQLTGTPEEEKSPNWCSDGERVAFSRRTQTSHIFAGDPRTGERRQITEGPDLDYRPSASRDGRWVAFIRQARNLDGAPRATLCIARTDTAGEVRSLDLSDLALNTEGRPFMWSYDGAQVAFSADDGTGNVDVYRIPREGGTPVRVTIEPGVDFQPAWSPDGTKIAYVRRAGGATQVWIIPATGGEARKVPQNPGNNRWPLWAFDSRRIAYYSQKEDMRGELWVTAVDKPDGARRLREAEEAAWPVRWSEDDSRVLVFRKDGDAYALWAVGMDGSLQTKVLVEGDSDPRSFPAFTEEGKRYLKSVFPGGVHVFEDGDDVSDVFVLRVKEALAKRAQEASAAAY